MRVAIIPARSGSKGLADKNIIDLNGRPLIYYTIREAIQSREFDKIIFSTDSDKYAKIAEDIEREIMSESDAAKELSHEFAVMKRGENLSNDNASTFDVIEDILNKINMTDIEYFVLLQPTSPLRNKEHIIEAINLFNDNKDKFDFLVSVKNADHSGVLVKPIEDDLSLKHFDTDFKNYKRQAFADYSPNGAIFIAKPDSYLERGHFFGDRSIAYKMDKVSSIDIDDEIDLKLARVCMI